MDELKAIFASNLIRLRNQAGYTQAELGQKLNYSDKSVSKWERAEALPDAFVLKQLAQLFGVSIDTLLSAPETWEETRQTPECAKPRYNSSAIVLVALTGICTLALLIFVVLWILGDVEWIIFPCIIPAGLLTFLVLHSVFDRGRYNLYIVMALVLSIFVAIYLCLLKYNPWQLFLVAIPAELVVWFGFRIRIHEKK